MQNVDRNNQLPGGAILGGERRRDFTLAALTGRVEMALSLRAGAGFHRRLSEAIAVGVERVGDRPVTADAAAAMSVGDRQFLARLLGARRGGDELWLTPECPTCGERFDVRVRQSEMPTKPAAEGYPRTRVRVEAGELTCRAPTGLDQAAAERLGTEASGAWLLDRLIESAPSGFEGAASLSPKELSLVERAIEAISPEVGTVVATSCPACSRATQVELSPYAGLLADEGPLLGEVHQLASAYHWSESEILSLPTRRRRRYLALLEQARGVRG